MTAYEPVKPPSAPSTWWRDFLGFVTLKPFGNNLCSPAASVWIFVARIAVFIMCTAEGLAWAYVAYWFTTGSVRYVAASGVFAAVFLLIAVVDSQFLTFDLHPRRYETAGPNEAAPPPPKSRFRRFAKKIGDALLWFWRTPIPGFIVRVAMVVGSLIVSTDYLTMAVLAPDIEAKLRQDRALAIEAGVKGITSRHDQQLAQVGTQITSKQAEIVEEVAGRGPTGIRGRGSTVATMEAQVVALEQRRRELIQAKAEELKRYDSLSDEERARIYGVRAAGAGGLQERSATLAELEKSAGFRKSQLPIKAILAGIFLTIIVLKAFQRRTVSIYFSDRLQATFTAYLDGAHDDWVQQNARVAKHTMTALEFEDWYKTTYAPRERARKLEASLDTVAGHYSAIRIRLDRRLEAIAAELKPYEDDLADVARDIVAKEDEIGAIDKRLLELNEIIRVNGEYLIEMDRLLEQKEQRAAGASGARLFVRALRNQEYYIEQAAKMEEEKSRISTTRDILDRDKQALEKERVAREERITGNRQHQQALIAEREAARDEELKALAAIRRSFDGA